MPTEQGPGVAVPAVGQFNSNLVRDKGVWQRSRKQEAGGGEGRRRKEEKEATVKNRTSHRG